MDAVCEFGRRAGSDKALLSGRGVQRLEDEGQLESVASAQFAAERRGAPVKFVNVGLALMRLRKAPCRPAEDQVVHRFGKRRPGPLAFATHAVGAKHRFRLRMRPAQQPTRKETR